MRLGRGDIGNPIEIAARIEACIFERIGRVSVFSPCLAEGAPQALAGERSAKLHGASAKGQRTLRHMFVSSGSGQVGGEHGQAGASEHGEGEHDEAGAPLTTELTV